MKTIQPAVAACIGCGCTDHAACLNRRTGRPCWWIRLDRTVGLGVCSECGQHIARWEAGDRSRSEATHG